MAHLGEEIDFTDIDPSTSRELLTPGWQKAEIVESEVKPTKKAASAIEYNETNNPNYNDKSLHLTYKILDGEYKGRSIWSSYNYVNASATAQEIARKDVAAIRHAIGIPKEKPFRDSNELHGKPMMILVDVEKSEGFKPKNIITGYKVIGDSVVGESPASATTGTAKPASKPAWSAK